jgi:deoxyribose-phosphate aldolase
MSKLKDLAKMIDHSILHPTMTDDDLRRECEVAKKFDTASVCVKPYNVPMAVECLKGSNVLVGCVIGFPHGNSAVAVKVFETEQAIKDGAIEIDMVVNVAKVLQEEWEYVHSELKAVVDITKKNGAILKVIFENDFIPEDKYKIKLCELCTELNIDYVKTSSGFGFVKGSDGKYSYEGATIPDLKLMRKHSGPRVKVKAAGGVRSLDQFIAAKEAGADRIGATATEAILTEAKARFGDS